MKNKLVRLCGIPAMLLTLPASAETKMVLDLPLERQVIQRNAQEWAEVKVAGTAPADATLVEAKPEVGPGLPGQARDWTVVAQAVSACRTVVCGIKRPLPVRQSGDNPFKMKLAMKRVRKCGRQ